MISCMYCHTEYGKKPGCEKCNLEAALTHLEQEIEKMRPNEAPLPIGIISAQRMRMETIKEGKISMAYDDGVNATLDDVLSKITEMKGKHG